jgi:DNA-binding transcriptional ArsR family regulator
MTYGKALEALSDPTRRAIFEQLRSGPRSVGELAAGRAVSQPAVSQHLRVLLEARLVRVRRDGRRRIYSVSVEGLESLRAYVDSFWSDVLQAFAAQEESA